MVRFPLKDAPRGASAHSVIATRGMHLDREALEVRLDPEVEADGVPGVDFIDQPTFLQLPVVLESGTVTVSVASETHETAPEYARGFAGIAFSIQANLTAFQAVYLRPLNGRTLNPPPPRDTRAIQYFSYPEWPFDRLRDMYPEGSYEGRADIAPGRWHQLTVSFSQNRIWATVDDTDVIDSAPLARPQTGAVGLFVDIGTRAWFSDLVITNHDGPHHTIAS